MLFNKEKNVVIITPMKVGSTTVHDLFDDKPGWVSVMGPHPWKPEDVEKHTGALPQWAVNRMHKMEILLLIRNPFDRIASFFHHWKKYHEYENYDIIRWMIEHFLKYCMTTKNNYYNPCTILYPAHTNVIRIEHLVDDLSDFNIIIDEDKIPHSNKTKNERSIIPKRFHNQIQERYYSDFISGEYDFK